MSDKTKAIIPVHLFGHACNMDKILDIGNKKNVKVIEDACQAHGTSYKGKMLGSLGHINVFSFTYHKTISSIGGGGALLFNEDLRKHVEDMISVENDNPRVLSSLRAPGKMSYADIAVLNIKLRYKKIIEENKKIIKKAYEEVLKDIHGCTIVRDSEDVSSVRQMYVGYFKNRDKLAEHLKRNQIEYRLPYKSAYLHNIFRSYCKGRYKNAERYDKEALFLPLFPFMKEEEVQEIANVIKEFYINKEK